MEVTRKKILLLSSWYPSAAQPFLGNFVERHARLLGQRYDVTVLITESREEGGIEVNDVIKDGLREIRVFYKRSTKLLERRRGMERALEAGLDRLKGIDLVIGHVVLQKGLQFVQAKKFFACPLILIEHASYYRPEIRQQRSWIESLIFRKTRKHCDEVVAVSEFLRKDMMSDFPHHSIQVIGNPVDAALFFPKEKNRQKCAEFLHVSTLDERTKNPEGLICACRALKDEWEDFRLTIISDEDPTLWVELSRHLELTNNIRFLGPMSWEEIVPYYHAADAFVLFSSYESFSIVLAEAWMTGTPVISTPVGIAADLPTFLGITVPVDESGTLASAMKTFASDTKQTFDVKAISDYGKQFSNEAILEKWTQLIASYLG